MKSYPMGICVATTAKEAAKLHEFMLEQMGGICEHDTDEHDCKVTATSQTIPSHVYAIYDHNMGLYTRAMVTKESAISYCARHDDCTYEPILLEE